MKKRNALLAGFLWVIAMTSLMTGCNSQKPSTVGVQRYPINEALFYSPTMQDRFYDTPVRVSNDRYGTHLGISTDLLFKGQENPTENPTLDPLLYPTLNQIVEVIELYSTRHITVAGFTDDLLTPQQQVIMSEKYARIVADYLVSQGVKPSQIITVRGEGTRNAIAENDDYKGRAANRRVEIIIHAQID